MTFLVVSFLIGLLAIGSAILSNQTGKGADHE